MTGQIVLRSPAVNRRQPLLANRPGNPPKEKRTVGEMAGGTTAECAAVCCCCPCGLMNLLVLAVYQVPKGLWRKCNLRRQRRKRDALLRQMPSLPTSHCDDTDPLGMGELGPPDKGDGAAEALELEKEMRDRFYGAGFWRSPSQRGT
ncbi:uncharacterized protein LOC131149494 [Malania oleifera]|uniref:uncharacterized protein LOC131149494 n=1 Tax=Malania oleifera TaxID=397392 RepID=UPI0025AE39BD|nr:uncharacterized protein LOC131149494 [Malania oleifera]